MKNIIKKIQGIDSDLCEKYPLYERIVNLWGLEQKLDIAIARKFPALAKLFTGDITIKRFTDLQKAELQKIKTKQYFFINALKQEEYFLTLLNYIFFKK
ncbi:MAG: hypothetical protein ACYCSQ_00625 [bacterium]